MKVKVESKNAGLKLNIQKTKIMASGPTTSWQIDGETVETVSDFIFWGSNGITDSMDMNLSKFLEMVMDREAWGAAIHGVPKSRTQLSD